VTEAFNLATSSVVKVGTKSSEATNGASITEAQLEAVGTKDVSAVAVGTWATASATGTTASQKVAKAITGTVGATSGRGTLVVEYFHRAV
jgi:hypothetical protein